MKQVKQIIDFILVLASCFFRFKKQQKEYDTIPSYPDPPGPDSGRKRDCHCGPGCFCNPDPTQPPESPAPDASGNTASGAAYPIKGTSAYGAVYPVNENRATPINASGYGATSSVTGSSATGITFPINENSATPIPGNTAAANLLGWCLIVVAGTSYLYKLLI